MTSLIAKVEALAAKIGGDADKLWHEFEAFIEGKHAEKKETVPASESPPAEPVSTAGAPASASAEPAAESAAAPVEPSAANTP